MAKKLKIKLVRSMISRPEKHRKTLRSMGLRKIGNERVFEDTPSIRGKIKQVVHMVEVSEVKVGRSKSK